MPERPDFDVSEQDYAELQADEHQALDKPVQVQLVGPVATVRELPARDWFGGQAAIDQTVQQVAGHLPQRSKLTIRNNGTEIVYLGAAREQVTPSSSFPLPAGASITFERRAASALRRKR